MSTSIENNMNTNSSGTNRLDWIDTARGMGIIFVMIGHLSLMTPTIIVYIFHMPLFFLISGYLFSGINLPTSDFIKKKAKRLIVPYYILSIPMLFAYNKVNHMIDNPFSQFMSKQNTKDQIIKQIVQIRYSTLWYISCLFWLSLIFYFIVKLTHDNLKIEFIICLIFIVFGFAYTNLIGWPLPGNIDIICYVLIFFFAGYVSRKIRLFENKWINQHLILCFIIFMLLSLILGFINLSLSGGKIDFYWNDYGIIPLMYTAAFSGVFAILCLSRKIKSRILAYIGRNSILFYAWHQAITFPLATWIMIKGNFLRGNSLYTLILQEIFCIAFSLITLFIPTYFIKKSRIAWIFGL